MLLTLFFLYYLFVSLVTFSFNSLTHGGEEKISLTKFWILLHFFFFLQQTNTASHIYFYKIIINRYKSQLKDCLVRIHKTHTLSNPVYIYTRAQGAVLVPKRIALFYIVIASLMSVI